MAPDAPTAPLICGYILLLIRSPPLTHSAPLRSPPLHPAPHRSLPLHSFVGLHPPPHFAPLTEDVTAAAYSVADNNVGGSPPCTAAIAQGHATIGTLFATSAGRSRLASLFDLGASGADNLKTVGGQRDFAGNGVAYFPSQGNDPSCDSPACNIAKICAIMLTDKQGEDDVDRLATLRKSQMAARQMVAEREELLAKAYATGGATGGAVPDFWGYQTCTEFGYYQTCEVGSKCFYTQGLVTLASMADFCYTDYGISIGDISSNVDATNAYYGGSDPRSVRNATSRILYVNGEVDPWHALSVLPPGAGPGLPAIMVPGASHHAWTHPSASTDQASVVAGRVAIRAQIQAWLTGAARRAVVQRLR